MLVAAAKIPKSRSADVFTQLANSSHTAVVRTTRPLLGSHRNGQTTLYLFQKYLLSLEHEYIVSSNKIDPVEVTFCVFFYNLFLLKIFGTLLRSIPYKKLHSAASFTIMFLRRTEKGWSCCAMCFPPDQLASSPPGSQEASYLTRAIV